MVDYKNDKNGIYTYINSGKEQSINLESFINSVVKLNFGELILNSIDKDGTAAGLDLKSIDMIPKILKIQFLMVGLKPEHFYETLAQKVSGIITANLFNFLGKGLEEARNYSIDKI